MVAGVKQTKIGALMSSASRMKLRSMLLRLATRGGTNSSVVANGVGRDTCLDVLTGAGPDYSWIGMLAAIEVGDAHAHDGAIALMSSLLQPLLQTRTAKAGPTCLRTERYGDKWRRIF